MPNGLAHKVKEHAISLWKHEENPDKMGINLEL